jgi:c-di-GMP phosphodiesterase
MSDIPHAPHIRHPPVGARAADKPRAMLRSLVDRLKTSRLFAPGGGPGPTVRIDRREQPSAAAPDVAAWPQWLAVGARRPLIGHRGELAGFEFSLPPAVLHRLRRRDDEAAADEHAQALFTAMRQAVQAGQIAYTELPSGWLERPPAPEHLGSGMLIGIPLIEALGEFTPEAHAAVLAMRRSGARVGWAGDFPRAFAPDFLLLPFSTLPRVASEHGDEDAAPIDGAAIERRLAQAARRRLPVLATGVAHIDDLELALRAGAAQASCAIGHTMQPRHPQPLSPRMQRLSHLLNRLLRDDNTLAIVADIKADVSLAVRLLQHLNAVGVGQARAVESIEQAVALLGRNELYRWLAVLMIQQGATRPAARALQEVALARGRLLELLAMDRGESQPGSLFMLGLLSMLGLLLDTRLEDAIEPLDLGDAMRHALLLQEGPWMEYLAMSWHLDDPNPLVAQAVAAGFGGLDVVLAHAEAAWAWAAQVTRGR